MNRSIITKEDVAMMSKINKDIIFWFGLIFLGIFTGATLMFRDVYQGFGSVTFGVVPDFTLTDQLGNSVTQDDFSNQVWVGSFLSTNCKNDKSCKDLLEMTASIHQQIKDDPKTRMVSLISHADIFSNKSIISTLDVQHDHWKFLNGDPQLINILATRCLQKKLPIGGYDTRLFLVDQNGIIRGYYQADRLEEVKKLVKDIKTLV
jgi:protein SCO1/2